ncbi:YfjI family protein [Leptospirillum ferriphilum]|nr:YfjI family protein [Leptospirillum ferriphilum]
MDFNDLGPKGKALLETPEPPSDGWGDPEPLNKPDDPLPFPLESLPGLVRCAVSEVATYTQAPMALIAGSALDSLSTAAQGLRNVQRGERLQGPTGTYRLSLAVSGERKTTEDDIFGAPIREWELEQLKKFQPILKESRAAFEAWEAEKAGIVQRIKEKSKAGQDTAELKRKLADIALAEPKAIRVPRILYGDITPEALAWRLSMGWPCGAVQSAEAGIIFGGHGMSSDSIMRNLALLNSLWDGGETRVDRRTSESFIVRGARLTMGLAVQPEVLASFFDQSHGLARGSGFLARFLLAWPESTQGTRFFQEAPAHSPMLTRYQDRITELLDETQPPDGENGLILPVIGFDPPAKKAWIETYNEIERSLAEDGELSTVRDVGAKAGDNLARLSAQYAILEGKESISLENVERASLLIAYHLHEARRIFAITKASPQVLLEGRLDTWLIRRAKETGNPIPKSAVLQFGPGPLRKKKTLDPALKTLAEANRIRISLMGRKEVIEVNPALFREDA